MTFYIYSENAQEHNGLYVNSHKLHGERPSWIPRHAWVLAHKYADLGAKDVIYSVAGEIWRVREESVKDAGINRIAKNTDSGPRFSRGCTRALSRD